MSNRLTNENILSEVIDAISELDTEQLLHKIDAIVAKVTDADSTGIYTLDAKTNAVILRASKQNFDVIGKLKMKLGEGITGWVAEHGKTVVIEEGAAKDKRFKVTPELPDDMYETFLSVPVKSGAVIVGVLNVKHKKPRKYEMDIVRLLEMIGKLVGRAVEHAVLLERTRDLEEALATQKAVSRAKGILMESKGISENDAYHLLRKKAMEGRKSMRRIAEAIVTSAEVFG